MWFVMTFFDTLQMIALFRHNLWNRLCYVCTPRYNFAEIEVKSAPVLKRWRSSCLVAWITLWSRWCLILFNDSYLLCYWWKIVLHTLFDWFNRYVFNPCAGVLCAVRWQPRIVTWEIGEKEQQAEVDNNSDQEEDEHGTLALHVYNVNDFYFSRNPINDTPMQRCWTKVLCWILWK